jgi:hypothetical protein
MSAPGSRRLLAAAGAASLIALLGLFAAATAAATERLPAGVEEKMAFPGTHGYVLTFSLVDGTDLDLEAKKKIGATGSESVLYLGQVRARGGEGVHTNLGRLGRISVHFVGESTRSVPAAGCRHGAETIATGHFVGRVDFRGERGYTVVHRHSIPGTVTHSAAHYCSTSGRALSGPGRGLLERRATDEPEWRYLLIGSRHSNRSFEAVGLNRGGKNAKHATHFSAYDGYSDRGIHVLDEASVEAPSLAPFQIEPGAGPPEGATIEPPAPFSGTGTFKLLAPHRAEWTGDLAVDLPTLGRVRLAGPGDYAGLCLEKECTKTFPKGKGLVEEETEEVEATNPAE